MPQSQKSPKKEKRKELIYASLMFDKILKELKKKKSK